MIDFCVLHGLSKGMYVYGIPTEEHPHFSFLDPLCNKSQTFLKNYVINPRPPLEKNAVFNYLHHTKKRSC